MLMKLTQVLVVWQWIISSCESLIESSNSSFDSSSTSKPWYFFEAGNFFVQSRNLVGQCFDDGILELNNSDHVIRIDVFQKVFASIVGLEDVEVKPELQMN